MSLWTYDVRFLLIESREHCLIEVKPCTLMKDGVAMFPATELSDLLYIIFVLAEHYGINLEEAFLQTVNDYILRFIR